MLRLTPANISGMLFPTNLAPMKLFFRESGQGPPLIILHGLFGSSDNWYTVAKTFSATHRVYLVDQRNHGQSPHSDDFNYQLLAEDLHQFVDDHGLKKVDVIGHSMGGKAAMNSAVKYPDQIEKLVVVDIVPKAYPVHHDRLVAGMKALSLDQVSSRNVADTMLGAFVPDATERQFLLKNLVRKTGDGFQWKINLDAIDKHLKELGEGMQYPGKFDKPTLFIRGARSTYFKSGDEDEIRKVFPRAKFVVLETGHWVQAESPVEFARVVLDFLD
jgi:esterase